MKFKHKRLLLNWNPGKLLIEWTRGISFSRRENVTLYSIINVFLRNLQKDEILDRANAVSFNFTLAIFPAIIFLFTLIPYVNEVVPFISNESILEFVRSWLPKDMSETAAGTIVDMVSNARGGLLTFGFVFSLYLSTNGMMALMRAFNACYKTVDKRSFWKMRLIATGLTLGLATVLLVALALLVVGQLVIDYATIHLSEFTSINVPLFFVLRFVVLFVTFFIAIATIYYFGPAIHYNWRFFSTGSVVATLLTLVVSYAFSYYITNFGTYNKVYGSIGVLIALMVWIQLVTIVLMVGYEINASIHKAIYLKIMSDVKRPAKS